MNATNPGKLNARAPRTVYLGPSRIVAAVRGDYVSTLTGASTLNARMRASTLPGAITVQAVRAQIARMAFVGHVGAIAALATITK